MKDIKKHADFCQQTINLRNVIEMGFLELGERLHKILEGKLYEGNWDSWADYLEDLKLTPASASKLIRIHQVFVLEYKFSKKQIAAVGKEVSYDLTRVVKTRKEAEEWLDRGQDLRLDDVRIAIKEHKSGVMQVDCHHNWVNLRRCVNCNVYEVLSA